MSYVINPLLAAGLDNIGNDGATTPGGSNTQVQFNDSGAMAGDADLTWNKTTNVLGVTGDINLSDGGTYTTTIQCVTPTLTNKTISFPDATGTVALVAGSSTSVQVNTSGAISGYSSFTYDDTNGLRLNSKAFGYGSGSGGTVTQSTNKSTGVTLNKLCGAITLNAAQLNADTAVSFTLTNSFIAATDIVVVNHASAGTFGAYLCDARAAAGSASVVVRNVTAGDLSEAIVLRFIVIKGVES